MNKKTRCSWAGDTQIYMDYHDHEWGRPTHDDRKLFEMLLLETAQAGLSWITILKKREAYRAAFDDFDPCKIAQYDDQKIAALMANEGIVRNRRKIDSAINNAKVFLVVREQYGSFDQLLWSYVNYVPIVGHWKTVDAVPATTPLSERISKDFKKMGFTFVGPTVIYALMQSVGMVNDHVTDCFVYAETV